MGNFGSKEDILVDIAVLFKQMEGGKLTLDELDNLVNMSRELNERMVILRYKAFEEKVFGVRPVVEETPEIVEEISIEEESIKMEEEIIPEIEVVAEVEIEIEEEIQIEEPLFQVEVKDEPSFGFSLFDDHGDAEEIAVETKLFTPEPVTEVPTAPVTAEEVEIEEKIEENNSNFNSEVNEFSTFEKPTVEPTAEIPVEKPMSDIDRAHAENLARFFNKSQETPVVETPVQEVVTPLFTEEDAVKIDSVVEEVPVFETSHEEEAHFQNELEDEIQDEVDDLIVSENEYLEEEEIDEVIEDSFSIPETKGEISYQREEVIESRIEVETEDSFDQAVLSAFVHKYNQVGSNLASQFGVSKLESLIGSFGLNERLQFINELFDGSSESFANAIKGLDQQSNSENARTKVTEFAIENNWDVDSETVEEFMQKVVRRYA